MKSVFALAVATTSLVTLTMGDAVPMFSLRHLDESRHSDALVDREVNLSETYTKHTSRGGVFCQPDSDGYFGSTQGYNTPVSYAFAVEYMPEADLNEVFQQFSLLLEDTLLGSFFPKVCKYETNQGRKFRNLAEGKITGFRFSNEVKQMAESCEAKTQGGTCAVYEGTLLAYGQPDDLVPVIFEAILGAFDEDSSNTMSAGMIDLYVIDMQKEMGQDAKQSTSGSLEASVRSADASAKSGGLESAAIVGIVISLVALTVGIAGFVYVEKRRRQARASEFSIREPSLAPLDGPSIVIENGMPTFTYNNDYRKTSKYDVS